MPLHPYTAPRGRLETFTLHSEAAADNRLGDPADRLVHVYLPEGYDEGTDRYPLFMALAGFTGSGAKLLSWQAFAENLPQRIDRLVAEGRMGPVVCVLPDCFTALGGNQYVNSAAMGRWADFLVADLVPAVEARYRVRADRSARAVFGKSSGGYGALVHGMQYAAHWGAVACHSGDMGFEWCYLGDLPRALAVLARHGGEVGAFIEHVRSVPRLRGEEMHVLMTLALAATYAPDEASPLGVRLPVDPRTCELDVARWARWLDHDPVRMVRYAEVQENLRRLSGLFIDCGTRDEYNLLYGARQLHDFLEDAGVPHRFEEFEGGHSGIDHRMDVSLPFLYRAVTAARPYEPKETAEASPDGAAPHPAEACLDAPGEEAPLAVTQPSHPIPSQAETHRHAPPGGVPGGCPKCRTEPMRQEVHGDVEIDRCPVCKGIFLDAGELETLLSAEIGRSVDGLSFTGVSEMMDGATAWCIRCGSEMGPVRTIAGVLVNVCDRCGTVFLDQGELAALELFRS
jgi:enterochelin esterase-like enzyme/Zn-finger nucleic acid-binding protein